MEIDILPLAGSAKVPKTLITELAAILSKRDIKTRILKSEKIPKSAYVKGREQYDAHKILEKINKREVLALTSDDIFDNGMSFVYGLGNTEGSAIVSTFRLRPEFYGDKKNEKLLVERIAKESMHEIGHTLGVKHCKHKVGGKTCAMTFSTNIHEVDSKSSEFCKEHSKMLE